MKNSIALMFLMLLVGCVRHVPLHNKYPTGPVYGESNKGFEEVWANLIDLVTDNGFDLKFIDKTSGFVMSDEISFRGFQTAENKKGKLVNPDAYIVTSRTDMVAPEYFILNRINAKWSVVLKPLENGGTEIKAVITDIQATNEVATVSKGVVKPITHFQAFSLHNFEKFLIDAVK